MTKVSPPTTVWTVEHLSADQSPVATKDGPLLPNKTRRLSGQKTAEPETTGLTPAERAAFAVLAEASCTPPECYDEGSEVIPHMVRVDGEVDVRKLVGAICAGLADTPDGREIRARTLKDAAMIVEGQRPGTTLDEAAAALRREARALRTGEAAVAP